MDHGKIVETGTHQALLQQNGLYASLIKLQQL
jgi:ABC-type multidrug transport system fused ATPase/permease subunit